MKLRAPDASPAHGGGEGEMCIRDREYTYRDVVVPDGIPAIVPQDLFDRVQEKLAKNKKAPARHKAEDDYLLTTKLFCGYCGAYLLSLIHI